LAHVLVTSATPTATTSGSPALTARGLRTIVPGIEDHVERYHVTRWNPALLLGNARPLAGSPTLSSAHAA
jgi:hypothetical protein